MAQSSLAVWAEVGCTVNRPQDRDGDLDLLAELGVHTLRLAVLSDRWPDARMERLRALHIDPIVGLASHGSGPTSLVDPGFPEGLARHAAAVATRYPWVTAFTPLTEPLTTARFAGLYGRDDRRFARAIVNQCAATAQAMRAIRTVTPEARLVTTEDLGATYASPRLAYQATFENERRWLSVDLLCGRVDRRHPLRLWLLAAGIPAAELDHFVAYPCPPDVIGCNYDATSERYLDERIDAWPRHAHGGNGREHYADVAAARSCGIAGPAKLLEACHARFGRPIAITETHFGGTREDQLRWLVWLHDQATRARAADVPVIALTAWAPSVFDVRGSTPRPTELAEVVRAFAAGRRPEHPVLAGRGWWERVMRDAA